MLSFGFVLASQNELLSCEISIWARMQQPKVMRKICVKISIGTFQILSKDNLIFQQILTRLKS